MTRAPTVCAQPGCPQLATHRGRCPTHGPPPNATRSPGRNRSTQHRFRQALIAKATARCEALLPNGQRCPTTTDLRAHHLIPLSAGGNDTPANGQLLCAHHDKLADPYAR